MKSKYRIKKQYLEKGCAVYVKGKSQYWIIGGEDVEIPNPPNDPTIRKVIPSNKIYSEFISIGITGFFDEAKSSDGQS